jgi:hypothetical protein
MVINNSGNLTKEYFIAYVKLIMVSTETSIESAKSKAFERQISFGIVRQAVHPSISIQPARSSNHFLAV